MAVGDLKLSMNNLPQEQIINFLVLSDRTPCFFPCVLLEGLEKTDRCSGFEPLTSVTG